MTTTPEPHYDTDVLIVGAGPIGMATACALRHHGVSCRILEMRTKPKEHSRANNFWARPQELLASIGVRDRLAEQAYEIEQVNTILNGRPIAPVEVADVASPYAKVLYSGQDVIERTLSDICAERGAPVERGRKVMEIEQGPQGVSVAFVEVDDDGEPTGSPVQHLHARYLIGADGTAATIREAIGLGFEPEKLPDRMNRQVDAKLSWRRTDGTDQLWFFYYKDGFAGIMPVWGGYHRLFFLESDAGVPDRDPTLEEIQAHAREVTGDDTLTLTDPIWFSHSRFQHGAAKHYAQGRVFLVGDAGHHTLPIGGQGMNAGFHDAIGIAWRLAMTLAGTAAPAVLDSYDAERGGEHIRLDDQQARGFANTVHRGPLTDFAMNLGAKAIPNIGALIQGTNDLQQLAVRYPDSPLNDDHLTKLTDIVRHHAPHAGERAPDAAVVGADGRETTLFAQIYNPDGRTAGWSLLAFDGGKEGGTAALLAAAGKVAAWSWVRPRLILAARGDPAAHVGDVAAFSDMDDRAHAAYGVQDVPALILVRPDGHIGFRGRADRPDLLHDYCEKMFALPVAA